MAVDAIIVGAGLNGLVAAVQLARRGWSTVVLERDDEVGGAVRTSGHLAAQRLADPPRVTAAIADAAGAATAAVRAGIRRLRRDGS